MGNFPTRVDTFVRVDAGGGGRLNQTMGGEGRGSVTAKGAALTASSLVKGRIRGWHVVFVAVAEIVRGSHVEWTCVSTGLAEGSSLLNSACVGHVVLPF